MSRASVRIRPAEHADVEGLVTLIGSVDTDVRGVQRARAARPATRRTCERGSTRSWTRPSARCSSRSTTRPATSSGLLVAKLDEIGAIDLTPVLHVTHLLVAPKQRRRGVGRALLAGAVHLADERGVDRVLATAASGSREANRYLARLGFAPLVVHRVASTAALRRSLGLTDASERMAVLRRARLVRAHRNGLTARVVGRGA